MDSALTASDILHEQETQESARLPWINLWNEVAWLLDPKYVNTFSSFSQKTDGRENSERQFDATAALARDRGAAAVHNLLTPDLQKWHRYRALNLQQNKVATNLRYFDDVRDTVFRYRYAPSANFIAQIAEHWSMLLTYGNSVMFADRLDGGGLRYKLIHLGEVTFAENHQGIIDTVHRRFKLTARQAAQKFGDQCPAKIVEYANDSKRMYEKFTFIHCVKPRADYDPTRMDYKGMKFASYYVCVEEQKIVSEGGYRTMPYIVSRYSVSPGSSYSRSPVINVMPSIRVLQEEKKTILKAGQRAVDPVLLAHDDGVIGTINLRPGYTNYGAVDSQGRRLVHSLEMGNLPIGKELMDDERLIIKDALFVTLFQILTENPQMTATEVLERIREKGILLSPLGRQNEALSMLNMRELDLLQSQGLLPPMPGSLAKDGGWQAHVVYDSPLSRAMQAEEASGFMRTLETAVNLSQATQDPSALDWLDIDTAMPEIADIQAVPARWIRSFDQVQAIRANRQNAQAMQQMADAAPAISSILKTTGTAANARASA